MTNETALTQPDDHVEPQGGSKSTRQTAAEYAEAFSAYIADLKTRGRQLPSRNGKVDKTAIAKACNFRRLTLYKNEEVMRILEDAVEEIGIDGDAHEEIVG